MTAALGFVYENGIVIGADTLMTGALVSRHASKIGGFRFSDGVVVFALAGHTDMGEAAMQQCELPLQGHSGHPRPRAAIAELIRRTLAKEYKEHIIENKYEGTDKDYSIIVGVFAQSDGFGLYCTAGSQMKRSRHGCEVIGSGETHAFMALERMGGHRMFRTVKAERASMITAYALGEAKRHQQGYVGGDSVIVHIEPDGMISAARCNEQLVEEYATKFHKEVDSFLGQFLYLRREPALFHSDLQFFIRNIYDLRNKYQNEAHTTFYLGPIEASETLWEINPREYLERTRPARLARILDSLSPTADQSPQPPSPESPEGSDES